MWRNPRVPDEDGAAPHRPCDHLDIEVEVLLVPEEEHGWTVLATTVSPEPCSDGEMFQADQEPYMTVGRFASTYSPMTSRFPPIQSDRYTDRSGGVRVVRTRRLGARTDGSSRGVAGLWRAASSLPSRSRAWLQPCGGMKHPQLIHTAGES